MYVNSLLPCSLARHGGCSGMQVFALVRYVEDPQRFSIEYSNGKISRYTATDR